MSDAPSSQSYCLFQEPWWLDLTTRGDWNEVRIANGNEVIARLPYRQIRRYGARILTQPPLTPYLGPWYRESTAKAASQFSERRRLTAELVAGLPKAELFLQNQWPKVPDCLPMLWEGFSQRISYTHWFEQFDDIDALWRRFLDTTRNDIRKAEKRVEAFESDNVDALLDLHEQAFTQRGLAPPRPRMYTRGVVEGALRAKKARLLLARDEHDNLHAANLVVFDERSAHYLLGGSDARFRASGAASLLLWDAIKFAAARSRVFDFEGSMREPIARFFRGFNPDMLAVSRLVRASRPAAIALNLIDIFAIALGRRRLQL
jgi:hypothetical protein